MISKHSSWITTKLCILLLVQIVPLLEVITFGYRWPLEMGPQIVKLKI